MNQSNPYSSPESAPASNRRATFLPNRRFGLYFAIGIFVMVGVNLLPLYFTWRAYQLDGYECVGWPFVVFQRGGFAYTERFDPFHLMLNTMIAVAAAYMAAYGLKYGWRALLHRLGIRLASDEE